jgi:hypothetical protein
MSGTEMDWAEQERRCVAALASLDFLLGRWAGEGQSFGAPLRGEMLVERILGGTFVEASERLYRPDGQLDYEDRAFYRYDAREERLRVQHLMSPGHLVERDVLPRLKGPGLRWTAGPFAPRVDLIPDGDSLHIEICSPLAASPDGWMRYRRSG